MGPHRPTALADPRRWADAAGAGPGSRSAPRFAIVAALGLLVDLAVFQILWSRGAGLAVAHVSGFLAASLFGYPLYRRWVFPTGAGGQARYLVLVLLALALRGGVSAVLVEGAHWPAQLALLAGAAVAAAVSYPGAIFFVFAPPSRRGRIEWRTWAIGGLAFALALKLVYLGLLDLLPEEAYYWDYTQHPDWSYLDHPPMIAWLIRAGTAIFGSSAFGVRIGNFLLSLLTVRWTYGLTRNLFGKNVAFGAAMFAFSLPFLFFTGYFALPDGPVLAFWAGTLFYLERALLAERRGAWIGAGVCLGLGMDSKYTIVLLAVATLLFMISDRRSRAWLQRPEPYAAALIALLLFTPVLVWNAQHDWASFTFQGSRRMSTGTGFSLDAMFAFLLVLLTPPGLFLAFRSLAARDPVRRRQRFLATVTLLPLSVFVAYAVTHRVQRLSWTEPIWLGALPAMAYWLNTRWTRPGQTRFVRLWKLTAVVVPLIFAGLFHLLALGIPGLPAGRVAFLPIGWKQAAAEVDSIAAEVEKETGHTPLVVDARAYYFASEMAFYRRQPAAAAFFVGGRGLMYRAWLDPDDYAGEPMVLVSRQRNKLRDEKVAPYFGRLGGIGARDLPWRGKSAGTIYFRIAYDYIPPPPSSVAKTH